jgi:tRNA(Ile)-lysidine synthase
MAIESIREKFILNLKSLLRGNGQNHSVLVAFSGGIDSRCLLDLMLAIAGEMRLEISAAYVNHNLRGKESASEEKFVSRLADILGIRLYKKVIEKTAWDLKGESIEMAARRFRYDFFNATCRENHIEYVATAHNLNDNIETFFLKILRAGGVETLSSIPAKNRNIIRPLLNITRNEIIIYSKERGLEYVEDSTNKKNIYKRNMIRNLVMPVLPGIQPGFERNMERLFGFFEEEKKFVSDITKSILKKITVYRACNYFAVSKNGFSNRKDFIKKNLIKMILKKINYPAKPDKYLFRSLLVNRKITYKKNDFLCIERGNLLWFINNPGTIPFDRKIHVNEIPFSCESGSFSIELKRSTTDKPGSEFVFDLKKVKQPLCLRYLKNDDKMATKENISVTKILKNMKIPTVLFKEAAILTDSEKVVGFLMGNIFRVSKDFYIDGKSDVVNLKISRRQ